MFDSQSKNARVALYARVSTEEQREGQTIDAQIAEITKFANEKGWTIANTYKDEGWSGSILARPALDRLRDDATKGIFDAVLVNDVDRLARDVSHLGVLKRDIEGKRILLVFRKLPGETSPTYNLMVNILGSFAEFERELIIDRTRRGRRHKAEVRKQYVGCSAAYGYHYQKGSASDGREAVITIIPEEAKVVRDMYGWALGGLSIEKIARRLGDLGIPTRKQKGTWQGCTVYRILRNEMYTGLWAYGKSEACVPTKYRVNNPYRRITKTGRRRKPRSEWLQVDLGEKIRIIDRELWRRVQERISRNPKFSVRNTKFSYLLQGLVRCAYCGHSMCGIHCRQGGKLYFYYRCWYQPCRKGGKGRWIPTAQLDSAVWKVLRDTLANPRLLAKRITAARTEMRDSESKRNETAKSQMEDQRERELLLFARYRSGVLSPQQLASGLQSLAEGSKIAQSAQPVSPKAELGRPFAETCKLFVELLDNPALSVRQEIIRRLVTEIIVEIDRVRVRASVPPEPDDDLTPDFPKSPEAGPISSTTLPRIRECRGNTRMELDLTAVLPLPAPNSPMAVRQSYLAAAREP